MDHKLACDSLASERYLLGELEGPELKEFEQHTFSCAECCNDLVATYAFMCEARAVLAARRSEASFSQIASAISLGRIVVIAGLTVCAMAELSPFSPPLWLSHASLAFLFLAVAFLYLPQRRKGRSLPFGSVADTPAKSELGRAD
jgi:hypothetical protein